MLPYDSQLEYDPAQVLQGMRTQAAAYSIGSYGLVRQLWRVGLPYGARAFDFWYRTVPGWLYEDLNHRGVPWIGVRPRWLTEELRSRASWLFLNDTGRETGYEWWNNRIGTHVLICLGVRLMLLRAWVRDRYFMTKIRIFHPGAFGGQVRSL